MSVLISVLVPIFNVEKYLRECLDSIVTQSYNNLEIICVNDGSTDGSLSILKVYEENDSRVVVVNKENSGYGKSMNIALRMAKGKYVAIVESDDFIEKNMIENLVMIAEQENAEVVRANYYLYTKLGGDKFYEYFNNCTYNSIIEPVNEPYLFFNGTWLWTSLYRLDFLRKNDINFNETPGASYQDIAFTLKVLSCAKRVWLLPGAYLHYRIDNLNASIHSKSKAYCVFDEFDELWRFLDERPEERDLVAKFITYFMVKSYDYQYRGIADKFKRGFVEKAVESIVWLNNRGYLQDDILGEYKKVVHDIIDDSNSFLVSIERDLKKRARIRNEFWKMINDKTNIYLYGAGAVASQTVELLSRNNVGFKNVYVGVKSDVGKEFYGKKTKMFSDNINLGDDSCLLIAVGEKSGLADIISKFADSQNVIAMTKDIREILTHG